MKVQKFIFPLFALAALASCGGGEPAPSSSSPAAPSSSSAEESSSQAQATYEAYTLSQLHEARVANTLPSLKDKYVAIKGKVTFAKHAGSDDGALIIQNGKYAVEVAYPDAYNVNVGDSVEVKGRFNEYSVGDTSTISVSTYSSVPGADIKVINESISVETVKISKDTDVTEFAASLSSIDFEVVGNRTNAAFIGKLSEGSAEFIVANRLDVAEKIPSGTYEVGDKLTYTGVFTYSGSADAKVIRYFDANGFVKSSSGGQSSSAEASSEESSAPAAKLTAVYFKEAEWWGAEGARTGIYLYNEAGSSADWPGQALESLGNGVWKYTIDPVAAYTNLIFTRIGKEDVADWGAKTIDLSFADIDANKPLYDISSVTTPVWGDPGVSGVWTAFAA